MRYLVGLFDAPAPVAAGLDALASAGIRMSDVRIIASDDPELAGSAAAVSSLLRDRGVPAETAMQISRAVEQGAVLVFARVPTARAAAGAHALRGVGALSPSFLPDAHARTTPPDAAGDAVLG